MECPLSETRKGERPLPETLQEYARGLAGGLLFSLPLLYTMEVWWAAFQISPGRMLFLIGATFLLLLGYNRFAGLRPDTTTWDSVVESVEEMGLGLLTSVVALTALGRLDPAEGLDTNLGLVLVEGMICSIGVSVGTAQLGTSRQERGEQTPEQGLRAQLILAACGGVLFAGNVAPTEEVLVLGLESSPVQLLGMVALSLLLSLMVTHGTGSRKGHRLPAATDMVMAYSVGFLGSAAALWVFGRFDGVPLEPCLGMCVVLALPGTLGASVGRYLLT